MGCQSQLSSSVTPLQGFFEEGHHFPGRCPGLVCLTPLGLWDTLITKSVEPFYGTTTRGSGLRIELKLSFSQISACVVIQFFRIDFEVHAALSQAPIRFESNDGAE